MALKIKHVWFIPDQTDLADNTLYISLEFGTCTHLCPCGCGNPIALPLDKPHGWSFKETDGKVTLSPSISSYQLPCKSHYFIRNNEIVWA